MAQDTSRLFHVLFAATNAFALVVVGLSAYIFNDAVKHVDVLGATVAGLTTSVAELATYSETCNEKCRELRVAIQRNVDGIAAVKESALARHDPFTGTEGAELERRIDSLERGLATLATMTKRVDGLEQSFLEERRYYRSNITPMVQQIQQGLQMQIQQGMGSK